MATPTHDMIRSEYRRPVNAYQQLDRSIHNDTVAQPLGLRGGTVAGSVHMDQFPPTLIAVFGNQWFETGSLSLAFKNATIDAEPVAVLVQPVENTKDVQTNVAVERDDGMTVAIGTASVGAPVELTYLHNLDLRATDPSNLRILADLEPGQLLIEHPGQVTTAEAVEREAAGLITEPLTWYTGGSPWGGAIASPSAVVRMLYRRTSELISPTTGGAVGLFGAIEIRHLNGPVMADEEYQVQSRLTAVGESPKTEYLWFDSVATKDGQPVASMRMQLRYMKASSSFYVE